MFFSKNLEEIDHCFFSKLGGVSTDQYYSLNCGKGSNDNKSNIKRNLKFVADYYDLKINNIITLHQTHSNKALIIPGQNINKHNLCFDGLLTNKKNIILGRCSQHHYFSCFNHTYISSFLAQVVIRDCIRNYYCDNKPCGFMAVQ